MLAVAVGGLVLLTLLLHVWAWASVDTSSIARAIWWRDADVGDRYRFPWRSIPAGADVSPLPSDGEIRVPAETVGEGEGKGIDAFLRTTGTLAFVIVRDDRIVFERYFDGAGPKTRQTSFSVAKSFLSALVGIAIGEGVIRSVEDPVTEYVPELAARDERFELITIRDLLTMSSGLRYEEQSLPLPWGDDIDTYYGTDLREVAVAETEIERPPGEEWHYNNYNPLLLGLVLERATGMTVSRYMSTRLWQPLGARTDATWSLDSEASGFEKMESGLNAAPLDYARFGLMFLHGGRWNGGQIVPREWTRSSTSDRVATTGTDSYGYFWWVDEQRAGRFYALGNFGQYLYVAPDVKTVLVRLGRDWGVDNQTWLTVFRNIVDTIDVR